MKKKNVTPMITLWINRAVAVLVGVLLFTLPALLDWYARFRELSQRGEQVLTIAFYCCAVVIGVALWSMDGLLRSILKGEVFIRTNVRRIQRIRLCCGLVSLICLPTSFFYPPLLFLVIIMAFLCLVVSVVASVMDAAVTIREENDLSGAFPENWSDACQLVHFENRKSKSGAHEHHEPNLPGAEMPARGSI